MEVEPRFKQPKPPKAKGRARAAEPLAIGCEFPDCQRMATDRHHKLRRSQGGTDDVANTVDLCQIHHSWVHSNPEASYRAGWLIRSTAVSSEPRSFTVRVPGDPGSLNRDKKLHWSVVAEMTRQFRTDAYHLALLQRPIVTFTRPVLVTALAFKAKGVLPDPGNSYRAVKAIVDGLRDAGVLSNDTGAEITGVLLLAPQKGPDGLEVTLDEVPGEVAA